MKKYDIVAVVLLITLFAYCLFQSYEISNLRTEDWKLRDSAYLQEARLSAEKT